MAAVKGAQGANRQDCAKNWRAADSGPYESTIHAWRGSRRAFAGVAAAGGATVMFAACGKSRGSRPATSAQSQAGKPRYGGQLNLIQKQDIDTLDPASQRGPAGDTMNLTNNRLLGFKAGPGLKYNDLILQPELAQRWETPDAQTYTFHLQQGVNFANLPPVNGRALTSADVKFSLEYLTRTGPLKSLPPVPIAALFEGMGAIETPDASTVVVQFARPFAPFLNYVALVFSAIVAHEIFDQDGDFSKRAAGTGPWQMDNAASQRGARYVFKRNPTYFVPGRPYVDQINWLILPDDATDNAAFQSKQVDIMHYAGLDLEAVQQIKKSVPDVVVHEYLDPSGTHVYVNTSKPPLNDARVRKAVGLSIDRDEFIRSFSNGNGQWALAGSKPGLFTQEETKQILSYDPAAAKQLVAQAGFPNGVDIAFTYPPKKYGVQYTSKLQLLQAQLKKGGINLVLRPVDDSTFINWVRSGDFQLSMVASAGSVLSNSDLDSKLYPVYYPKSVNNYDRIDDPELTPLLDAQRRETDPAKRTALFRQAIQRISGVPWDFDIYYGTSYDLWQSYVKNYNPNLANIWGDVRLTDCWLEK